MCPRSDQGAAGVCGDCSSCSDQGPNQRSAICQLAASGPNVQWLNIHYVALVSLSKSKTWKNEIISPSQQSGSVGKLAVPVLVIATTAGEVCKIKEISDWREGLMQPEHEAPKGSRTTFE